MGLAASAILVAGMVGTAAAADLPEESPSPVAVAASTNWTGIYVGIKGSYNWAEATGTVYGPPPFPNHSMDKNNPQGAQVGGELGYNFQGAGSPFVFGASVDFQTGGFSDSAHSVYGPFAVTGETKLNNLGSVQARLGYAMGRWLPFVSGGYAFGQGEHTSTIDFIGSSTFSDTKWYSGWTAGVGTEYAINKHWSLKGEYRYTDLGSETLNLGGVGTKVNLVNQSVDFGVNYRF
jgi:outer membrane immunogenic protein